MPSRLLGGAPDTTLSASVMAKGKSQRRAKAQTPVCSSKNAEAETKSTTKSTTTASTTASDGSNVHLTLADYKVLVDWLEVKQNFEALQGVSGKTTVGGPPKITKRAAFAAMATYLFAETTNKRLTKKLKPEQMQGRWRTYMNKYREANDMSKRQTGMGLEPEEIAAGMTIADKLNNHCPEYSRLEALYGEKPNISPSKTAELGVPVQLLAAQSDGSICFSTSTKEAEASGDLDLGTGALEHIQQQGEAAVESQLPIGDIDDGRERHEDPEATGKSYREKNKSSATIPSTESGANYGDFDFFHSPIADPSACSDEEGIIPSARVFSEVVEAVNLNQGGLSTSSTSTTLETSRTREVVDITNDSQTSDASTSVLITAKDKKRGRPAGSGTAAGKRRAKLPKRQAVEDESTENVAATSNNSKPKSTDKPKPSAHDSRISLTMEYARNGDKKIDFMQQKLKLDQQIFLADREDKREQREIETEQRRLELELREREIKVQESGQRYDFFLALVKEGKSPADIEVLLATYDRGVAPSG